MLPSAKACNGILKESYFSNTGQMTGTTKLLLSGVQTEGQLCLQASFYRRPNILQYTTSCEELPHWKRPWYWEGLGAGEGDDRGWDGWMASLTRWTWVWVNSGSWWWTGRPGVLRFMGSQRVRHDWVTELDWIHYNSWHSLSIVPYIIHFSFLLIITQWEKWITLSSFFG